MLEKKLHLNTKVSNRLVFVLSLYGLIISIYLLSSYLNQTPLLCLNSGCEKVRESEFSKMFSIPIPAYGALAYLTIMVIALVRAFADKYRKIGTRIIFFFALAGFGFSAYLTYLEAFVIKAFCMWCVFSAIIVTQLLFISLWEVKRLRAEN